MWLDRNNVYETGKKITEEEKESINIEFLAGVSTYRFAFFLTSAVGLALNEFFMLLFRIIWGEDLVLFTVFSFTVSLYVLNKVLSSCIVMIWNYFTKRMILTKK